MKNDERATRSYAGRASSPNTVISHLRVARLLASSVRSLWPTMPLPITTSLWFDLLMTYRSARPDGSADSPKNVTGAVIVNGIFALRAHDRERRRNTWPLSSRHLRDIEKKHETTDTSRRHTSETDRAQRQRFHRWRCFAASLGKKTHIEGARHFRETIGVLALPMSRRYKPGSTHERRRREVPHLLRFGEVVSELGPAACPDCGGAPGAVGDWQQTERRLRDIEQRYLGAPDVDADLGWLLFELRRTRSALLRILTRCQDADDDDAMASEIRFYVSRRDRDVPPSPMTTTEPTAPVTRTHCPYCAFQCGMTIRVLGKRGSTAPPAVHVRGDEAFPVNRGQMCIKGFTSARAARPPGAAGARRCCAGAAGALVPASWETALDFVAERLLAHPRRARPGGAGGLRQRRAHQREGVPARQVRPRSRFARRTSTTTAATAWRRRRPGRTAPSASTAGCRFRSSDIAETEDAPALGRELRRHDAADHAVDLRSSGRAGAADRRRSAPHRHRARRRPAPAAHARDRPRAGQRPSAPGDRGWPGRSRLRRARGPSGSTRCAAPS